jgi:hypothetical protein
VADRVVIDFDVTGLEDLLTAKKEFEGFGDATKKAATDASVNATHFDKLSASLNGVSQNIVSGTTNELVKQIDKFSALGKAQAQVVTNYKEQVAQLEKLKVAYKNAQNPEDAKKLEEQVKKVTDNVTALQVEITKNDQSSKSFKTQLRALKDEMALLESQGKENTAEFEQMAIKAAKLEDQIGDTSVRIRNMADDSRGIKTLLQGVQGITAAFSLAQASAALFGQDNKKLQETFVRLNALLLILNSLETLNTLIQKQSFVTLAVSQAQRKAQAVAIGLETAAESKNIIVRYAAIIAQKALNAVQAASPAGILLAVTLALAGAVLYFAGTAESAAEAETKLNDAHKAELETLKALDDIYKQVAETNLAQSQRQIEQRKAAGASLQELTRLEKEQNEHASVLPSSRVNASRMTWTVLMQISLSSPALS